jgi:hypothetical protein
VGCLIDVHLGNDYAVGHPTRLSDRSLRAGERPVAPGRSGSVPATLTPTQPGLAPKTAGHRRLDISHDAPADGSVADRSVLP